MTPSSARAFAALPVTPGRADRLPRIQRPWRQRRSPISIVAATNVYGDIALAVTGDLASVTSIITSSRQDPHEYEASVQDRLAIDEADIVIENGGGLDPFVETLLAGSDTEAVVLTAVASSESLPAGEGDGIEAAGSHEGEGAHENEGRTRARPHRGLQ